MSNDVKLEPCPFCGSDTAQTRTTRWNPFIDRWTVSCAHGCHADGPSHETEAEAIAAWNARHQSQQRDAVLEEAIAFARSESERAQKAEWSRDRALEENAANQRAKMAVVDMIAAHPKYARGSGGGVRRTDKTTGRIGEYKYTPAWEKVAEFIHGLLVEMGGDADTMWAEYLKAWEKHGCDAALTTPVRPAVSRDEAIEQIVVGFSDKAILRLDIDEDDPRLSRVCDDMRQTVRAILSRLRGEGE